MSEAEDEPAPAKPTKARTFLNRLTSTLWLWGLVIVAIWVAQPWVFMILFLSVSMLGLFEFFRLFPDRGYRRFRWQALIVAAGYGVLLFGAIWGWDERWISMADGLAIAALLFLISSDRIRFGLDGYRMLDEISMTIFGFVYIVILFGFLPKILNLPLVDEAGAVSSHFYVVFLLVVTKFTDMGAYLVGSLIGKDKMIPKISPGKTWQGFWGSLVFAQLGSFGCFFLFGEKLPLLTPIHAALLGVLLALSAVLGDLVESILKRSLQAKDSGHAMPGIGGVLDLIDSILLTGPVLFVYLSFLLR